MIPSLRSTENTTFPFQKEDETDKINYELQEEHINVES